LKEWLQLRRKTLRTLAGLREDACEQAIGQQAVIFREQAKEAADQKVRDFLGRCPVVS